MNPQLNIIDTVAGIEELKLYLEDQEFIAFDTETTGLTKHHTIVGYSVAASEDRADYVILAKWTFPTIASTIRQLITFPENIEASRGLLDKLVGKSLIMHNGIFDSIMVGSNFKIRLIDSLHTDTMVLAHLLNENRRIGLKELSREYFGENSTKEQEELKASIIANGGEWSSDNKEIYKADADLLAYYGAKDALLTYKLFLVLVPELYEQGLDKFFYEDESMPLLRGPTYELNTSGLQVDTKKLAVLKKQLEAECEEAKAFIYKEIDSHIKTKYSGTTKKNTFNIDSSQQMAWLLFGELELEFNTLTKGGRPLVKFLGLKSVYTAKPKRDFIELCFQQKGRIYCPEAIVNGKKVRAKKIKDPWAYITVDNKCLNKLSSKYRWIQRLIEYKQKTKLLGTYIAGIEECIKYGTVQSSFNQTGTPTGRYSSKGPNMQNLPRNDQRIKECFIARPGKKFASADESQLEPRIFAYYSQDKRLMDAFDGTSDFYSVVGIEVYDKFDATPQKDGSPNAFGIKYKVLRDGTKVFALAGAYGSTPFQLAPSLGKSIDDTAEDMAKYFERFPGVQKQMLDAHDIAKKTGEVTNLFGRKRRLPEALLFKKIYGDQAHSELPYTARNVLNMACNFRIQSTGASIMNRAAIKFYNDCRSAGLEAKLVLQVHDELIAECDEGIVEDVAVLLQNAMETAVQLEGIRFEAVPRITSNLAK